MAVIKSPAITSGAGWIDLSADRPYWSERGLNTIDPDRLTADQQTRVADWADWKERFGHDCTCETVGVQGRYYAWSTGSSDGNSVLDPAVVPHAW